jgi:hypothetical protein
MTIPVHEAEFAGHLRIDGGKRKPITVAGSLSDDTATLALSNGDKITAGAWPLTEAAIWMQGVIRGRWQTSYGASGTKLVILADDTVTRITSDDFSRVLELPTEPLQDALQAAQSRHETTPMLPPFARPGEDPADSDVGMTELVAQLWALGAITTDCCEDFGGRATVTFEDAASAEMFIDTVLRAHRPAALVDVEPESLYNRIVMLGEEPDDRQAFRKRRMWRLEAGVREYGVVGDDDQLHPDAELIVAVTVNFPVADLEAANAAVRAANQKRGVDVTAATYSAPPPFAPA